MITKIIFRKAALLFFNCFLIPTSLTPSSTENGVRPIDRQTLVKRHNIVWNDCKGQIPLGNGEFCFNADGTGLQTFGGNTLSHWGWHSFPLPEGVTTDQIPATGSFQKSHPVGPENFPKEVSKITGWMTDNPHIINLGRIRLINSDGSVLEPDEINSLSRTLDLWSGIHTSDFIINVTPVRVVTFVNPNSDMVAIRIESQLLKSGNLRVAFDFPYPSLQRGRQWLGNFGQSAGHKTIVDSSQNLKHHLYLRHENDAETYFTSISCSRGTIKKTSSIEGDEVWQLVAEGDSFIEFTCTFSSEPIISRIPDYSTSLQKCAGHWRKFWENGGAIDLSESRDPRWRELERRIVLSQYLMAVQSSGSFPSSEAGLMELDPWKGQFHMEMTWWHLAHYALWNRWAMAEKALDCYRRFAPVAQALAKQQGMKGFKWGKQVGPEGRTAPWSGNQVLLWKQPHPIFFAELDYRLHPKKRTLEKWGKIIDGTAEQMADYTSCDKQTGIYHLDPAMPPSEQGITKDDIFDLAYWRWGLNLAQVWRERTGLTRSTVWEDIRLHLAPLPISDSLYLHSQQWTDTYTTRAWEHPNLIGIYGMLPPVDDVDREIAHRTLLKVWSTWNWKRCWGWDFPWTAMAAARLGEPNIAIDALLLDAGTKNFYDERGVCTGGPCPYLPGNGGLLYAVAMMAAGWDGAPDKNAPGFPDDGTWTVRWEGLKKAL